MDQPEKLQTSSGLSFLNALSLYMIVTERRFNPSPCCCLTLLVSTFKGIT